jgi:hypothetical protein
MVYRSSGCAALVAAVVLLSVAPAHAEGGGAGRVAAGPTVAAAPEAREMRRLNPALAEAAASTPSADAPVALAGKVVDTKGRPARNVRIRLDLEPSSTSSYSAADATAVELIELGQTRTDEKGFFAFQVARLSNLAGYEEPDGSVSLLLSSLGDGISVMQHIIARPIHGDDHTSFVWDTVDDHLANDFGEQKAQERTETRRGEAVRVHVASTSDQVSESGGEISTAGVSGGDYCPGSFYWQRSDANIIKTYDRINRAYIKGGIKTWLYEWSTSSNTQVDAAANLGSNGSLVTAGYVNVASSSGGVNFSASSNTQYDARVEYDNRVWYLHCYGGSGSYYSGVYEWRPYVWTGGAAFGSLNTAIFNCNSTYISYITQPTWVTRSSTLQFSVGATLSTVNLRTSQTHNETHKLTLTPSSSGAYVCGYNNYITQATQVREV